MGKKDIHQLDVDQLAHLFHVATDGGTDPDAPDPKPEPVAPGNPPEKPEAFALTQSLHGSIEHVGSWVGPYRLVGVLGEGGMGIVYLADQTAPMRRRVALKVIKPGMDSTRVVARFEAERQALALLDHPNIAQVHDAGMTEAGRPYFVMEYVKGSPVTEYCDRHKLSIEDRLRLFQRVCHAVQHAHQKGIIHRDIKPSNILVSAEGDEAIAKIIDFGVAKATAAPLTERTLFTEDTHLLGTPEYMSPEQADMVNEDIDTRSDVYSLGVLLYVLLTGILPYDSETFRQGGVEHIRKIICETEPKTPSSRLMKLGEKAEKLSESRRTEITTLAKRLHRELEWIPLKAMRKDRAERYRSASELADDIENYLNGAPLIAGPPSTVYRLKKFVRRNRSLVTGIATLLVVLMIGIVVSTILAIGQARARAEAQLIADFLENDILGSVTEARVGEATITYLLDAASKNLEGKLKDKPLIEARIRAKLGWMYWVLGEPSEAEPHLLNTIRIYRQYHGEEHPATLRTLEDLGWVYSLQGRLHDQERLLTRILKVGQRVLGVEQQLSAMNALAVTYSDLGKYKDAELLFESMFQIVQRGLGEENVPRLSFWKCNLATLYTRQGRYEGAERLFLESLTTAKGLEGFGKGWELQYAYGLGNVYRELGQYDKAESLLVKALETQRLERGDEHRHTLRSMYGLACLYTTQDRYEEAESLFAEMLEIGPRRLGEGHPLTLGFVNGFAVLLAKQKRYDEAEPLFREALESRRQKLYEDHPDTLETLNHLGILRRKRGRYGEAEVLLTEALDGRKIKLGPDHPHTLESMHELALVYMRQACYGDAEPLLLDAFHGRETKLGPEHPHTVDSLRELANLYESWDKPSEAQKWRAKLLRREDTQE